MRSVYLCGPVSNGDTLSNERIKNNLGSFAEMRRRFDSKILVLDPTMIPKQTSWEDYMRLTIPMLCSADYVVLLDGWEESRGATLEVFLANSLAIPIMFADHIPIPDHAEP